MIDYKLKYQVSIFLNASELDATSKNIGDMMSVFSDKGFIPNTFQEISSLNPKPQNRFALQSPNREWHINFGYNRIDIEKNPVGVKGENLGNLNDFCDDVKDIANRILSKFPKKGNRLSLVTRVLLDEMPEKTLDEIYNRLFNSPQIYNENPPFEWNWRVVSHLDKEIQETNETFNVITTLNRISAQVREGNSVSSLDRVELNLDVNTIPQNNEYRFDYSKIESFLELMKQWHNELETETLNFITIKDE
tara:strand:- start:229 stop:975 length:747 start_codon:yes stop_codon:yes gene_type:complete